MTDRNISRLLALHPEIQQKLREECKSLSSLRAGKPPMKEEFKQMNYLRYVIYEGISHLEFS